MINLVIVRNPFDVESRETKELACEPSKPISFYFSEDGKWVYSINAEVADADTVVKDNDYIVIMPLIEGKWFRVLLTIGLSVATAGIFGATNGIFGAMNTFFWRAFSAMAISMVGNAIINKIAPLKTDISNTEQSTTYGWSGTQTVVGQGFPLAITYGSMKSGGMLLSRHIISDGEKQYLNMLYCAGEGEITSISDVRINDNPVDNYSDVEVDIRLGTNDQEVIPNFNDNYSDQQLAYELTTDWSTQLVEGNSCQGLEITLSLPNGLYYSNDQGGMSTTSLTVEAQYRVAGGEWASLPLANDDDASNPLRRLYTFVNGVAPWFNTFLKDISGNKLSINPDDHTGIIKAKTNEAIYRVYRFDNLPSAQYEVRVRCVSKSGTTIRYINKIYWSQLTQIVYDDFIHPGKVLVGIKALATDQLSGSEPQITWIQTRQNVLVYNPYTLAYETKQADNPAWACYDILHHARLIGGSYVVKGVPAGQLDYDAFNAWSSECTTKGYKFNYIYDSAGRIWDALQYPEAVGNGHVIIKGTRFSCVYDYASNPVQLFTVANIKKDSFKEDFQGTQGRANCVEISFMNAAKNYERDVIPVYSDDYDSTDSLNEPTQIELMGCTRLEQAYAHGRQYLRNNKYEIRTVTIEAFVDAIACTLGDVVLISHDVTEWGTSGRIKAVDGLELTLDADVTMVAGQNYSILVRNSSTDEINTFSVVAVAGTTNVITLASGTANVNDIFAFGLVDAEAKKFRVISIVKGHTEQTRKLTCMEYFDELYDDSGDNPPVIDYTISTDDEVGGLTLAHKIYSDNGNMYSRITASWILPRDNDIAEVVVYLKQDDEHSWGYVTKLPAYATSIGMDGISLNETYEVKICAINRIGALSAGTTASITIPALDNPRSVTGLAAESLYRQISDGQVQYDVKVYFTAPDDDLFSYAEIWYKTKDIQAVNVDTVIPEDVALVDLGFSGAWIYAGSGTSQVTISQAKLGDTYRFEAISVDIYGNRSPINPTVDLTILAKSTIPNTPQNLGVTFSDKVYFSWNEVTNSDVDFYELRSDTNIGQETGLLARVSGLNVGLILKTRTGTVYLYAHNATKKYSNGSALTYNLPAPLAPTLPTYRELLKGFTLLLGTIPANCLGINIYITGSAGTDKIYTSNNVYTYNNEPGVYNIQIAFVDMFSEGPKSAILPITIKTYLDPALIEQESLSLEKMDTIMQESLINNSALLSQFVSLVGDAAQYSGIAQVSDDIQLRVKNTDGSTSLINVSPDTITLQGKYLHITGDTVFDAGVIADHIEAGSILSTMLAAESITADKIASDAITADKIASDAITSDKISVTSLDALASTIGTLRTATTGARVEISDNLIKVYDTNNVLRVRMGVW